MRKFLFIILLIPLVASLGHDVYVFYQDQDKGFHFTDLGALWDKYHKESHDQWKQEVQEFSKVIDEMTPKDSSSTPNQVSQDHALSFAEGFKQTISRDGEVSIAPVDPVDTSNVRANNIQKWVGFILEQKAVLVFSLLPLIVYFLSVIFSFLFKAKKDDMGEVRKLRKKDGSYNYSRK